MSSPAVLLIGATGRTGHHIIQASAKSATPIQLHAFCRTPSKLPTSDSSLCTSVVKGDARRSDDVRDAIISTNPSVVIMSIGNGDSTARTDIREATARALMDVIGKGTEYEHVKVVLVSSTGAGGTKIDVGFGLGKILAFTLRHVMEDHDNQEKQFTTRIGDASRLLIVRPTALTENKPTGHTKAFPKNAKAPSIHTDREDLANWIIAQVAAGTKSYGREVSLTGSKN